MQAIDFTLDSNGKRKWQNAGAGDATISAIIALAVGPSNPSLCHLLPDAFAVT